jgi:hypothetical protein
MSPKDDDAAVDGGGGHHGIRLRHDDRHHGEAEAID